MSAKGIQKKQNVDLLSFENYKDVVLNNKKVNVLNKGMRIFNDKQINNIDSDTKQNRTIYSYSVEKIGLTEKYDKRIVLNDKISTVPLNI
jgi:hypothetical protein